MWSWLCCLTLCFFFDHIFLQQSDLHLTGPFSNFRGFSPILISLFWTSGYVFPGFQSQSGTLRLPTRTGKPGFACLYFKALTFFVWPFLVVLPWPYWKSQGKVRENYSKYVGKLRCPLQGKYCLIFLVIFKWTVYFGKMDKIFNWERHWHWHYSGNFSTNTGLKTFENYRDIIGFKVRKSGNPDPRLCDRTYLLAFISKPWPFLCDPSLLYYLDLMSVRSSAYSIVGDAMPMQGVCLFLWFLVYFGKI